MNLMNIEKITKVFAERKVFDRASFSLQEGEKVGVIGTNGTGKTTLLKMLAGMEEPDEGTITTANHVVIRYLPQHPEFAPKMSALECVLAGNVTDENRWTMESDAKAMMTRLGINDFEQPAGQLSGGQRKRLALISVLLSPADILLLDEPTNHLDNEMADWLEAYLKKRRGALIMVTHDRYFLDSVCNRIVEIDKGSIYSYQTELLRLSGIEGTAGRYGDGERAQASVHSAGGAGMDAQGSKGAFYETEGAHSAV